MHTHMRVHVLFFVVARAFINRPGHRPHLPSVPFKSPLCRQREPRSDPPVASRLASCSSSLARLRWERGRERRGRRCPLPPFLSVCPPRKHFSHPKPTRPPKSFFRTPPPSFSFFAAPSPSPVLYPPSLPPTNENVRERCFQIAYKRIYKKSSGVVFFLLPLDCALLSAPPFKPPVRVFHFPLSLCNFARRVLI
jgi:hypothetical protein